MHRITGTRRKFSLGVALLLLTAGCATPGPVLTESVGKVRAGTTLAGQQSNDALVAANAQARERSIEYRITDPRLALAEADFPLAVDTADIAAWQDAFKALDLYMAALVKLVDPAHASETADNINAVGTAFLTGSLGLKLPAGTGEAFATFGGALVQASAERKATQVMRRVDPAFRDLMATMARAIGATNNANLRGTVWTNWERALSQVRQQYALVTPGPGGKFSDTQIEARRTVAKRFVGLLDSRDAADANLAQLRASMFALAEAHHAAAIGNSGDALFWVGRISSWLDDIQKRINATKAAASEAKQ